jgi:hypothetical protein
LHSITVPESVTTIGDYAFHPKTIHIYCEAKAQPDNWSSKWNTYGCPVTWGYRGDLPAINESIDNLEISVAELDTADKIDGLHLNSSSPTISTVDDYGIEWTNELELTTETGFCNGSIPMTGHVPIVAGDNITFNVTDDNKYVKINATGGGSGTGMPQIRFVGMPCDGLFGYVNKAILNDDGDSVVGTWLLCPTVTIPSNSYFKLHFANDVNEYGVIEFDEGTSTMWYSTEEGDYEYEVYSSGAFNDSTYMTLDILEEPDDWEVAEWIRGNGQRVGETYDAKLKFTIEIVGGGPLQVGDTIQICRMGKYGVSLDKNGQKHPAKRKLRSMFDYEVTEDDLDSRFITFEVPLNSKTHKLFTLQPIFATSNETPVYFRIRRPVGNFNQGQPGFRTVDAAFSNVVSVVRKSYGYSWRPDPDEDEVYFYQIRIM